MTQIAKLHRLIVAVLAATVLTMGAVSGAAAQDAKKLRILYVPSFTGHVPILIAEDAGILDKNGVDAELIGTNEAIKPLLSGDADLMLPAPAVAVLAAAQGIGVKIVSSVQSRITQALIVQPDIGAAIPEAERSYPVVMKSLQGKKIGVSVRGGSVDLNLRYMLQAAGLTPDEDVFVVPLGSGGAMVAGLRAKQVDGVLAFPPLSNILLADGSGTSIVNLAKNEGPPALEQPFVVAAVLDGYLEKEPETVDRFVKAMQETVDYIRDPNNRDALSEIVGKRLDGVAPEILDGIIDELAATVDTKITRTDIENVNEVQRTLDILDKEIAPEEILAPWLLSN